MRFILASICFVLMVQAPEGSVLGKLHQVTKRSSGGGVDAFLEKYGYLDDLPDVPGVGHAPEARNSALREFQRFNGLPATGQLDRRTIRKMRSRRCGLPDVVKPKDRARSGQRLSSQGGRPSQNNPVSYYAPGYKWDKNRLTWKIMSYTRKLGGASQRNAYINAFRKWSDVTPLQIVEDPRGTVDIEISYGRRNHGDGVGNSFDGRGKTLAHAFFPGNSPIAGDTHFDSDEDWTLGVDRGTNLEIVAAHEFGHALGMGHSNVPDALMAPFYQGYDPNYGLHRDDIRGIQSLYGGRPHTPGRTTRRPVTSTRRPRVTTTRRPGTRPRSRCLFRFDAIMRAHNGKTYVFIKRYIYEVASNGVIWTSKKRIREVYPRAPLKDVGAATHHYGKTFIFKGSKVWKYDGFNLEAGYPKRLSNVNYRSPQAALSRPDGIYLFKGRNYTYWREDLRTPPSGYPVAITRRWAGVFRTNIDAILNHDDGYLYFFKGANYVKLDITTFRAVSGYPKAKAGAWLPGCGPRHPL